MRSIIILLYFIPFGLQAQDSEKVLVSAVKNTFSKPHINKWMTVSHFKDHSDTLYLVEAVQGKSYYESWEGLSTMLRTEDKIIVVDETDQSLILMPAGKESKHKTFPLTLLHDSMSFLFNEFDELNAVEQMDSGFRVITNDGELELIMNPVNSIIEHYWYRPNKEIEYEEEQLLSEEWVMIDHIVEHGQCIMITSPDGYIVNRQGEWAAIDKFKQYEVINLLKD